MEAYWLNGAKNQDGYSASLPAATDFALQGAFSSSINDGSGWDNGWTKVYGVLAHDFVYNDAETNMIFLDNHDMARLTHTVKNNVDKLKLGLAFLYTTRGIPQVYYGTELLWNGDGNNHGKIRMDMLGGWANDSVDIFAGKGLTSNQQEVMTLMKKLGDLRQTHECIGSGKLVHYIPEDNIYVYFRSFGTKSVMVILNGNDKVKLWNKKRYVQNLGSAVMGTDLMTGSNISLEEGISVAAFGFKIIEINQ
jgi:neopullulanase